MRRSILPSVGAAGVLLAHVAAVEAEPLAGDYGAAAGPRWAAAWLNLSQPEDFRKGDRLCFHIDGSRSVLVRFLPLGQPASRPLGIEGGIRSVPPGGALRVDLADDHLRTSQISVHGGESAWTWEFAENNAAPGFTRVERLSGDQACQ
jgi:hypothetical protein